MTIETRLAKIRARVEAATVPIPGFPDYEVSEDGRVYSLLNWRGYGRREVKPTEGAGGYLKVRLRHPDGRRVNRQLHRLVALAFMGARPPGAQIRHLNGDQEDCRRVNLAWGTAKQNAADRDRHGTTARGSRNGYARLTEDAVVSIRVALSTGTPQRQIASRFGVTQSAISNINRGRTWKHVA